MITEEHLVGIRTMHAAFRTEFGRLARACAAPRSAAHERLLEEQLALAVDVLHKHHHFEDESLWPSLIAAQPSAAAGLAELEREHEEFHGFLEIAGDAHHGWAARADALEHLHLALNAHLDHEERVAFPLMLAHRTPADIDSEQRRANADFGRRRLPLIFGWVASCLDDELLTEAVTAQPRLVRTLFRLFWWPAYQRRFVALYGTDATLPNRLRPVAG